MSDFKLRKNPETGQVYLWEQGQSDWSEVKARKNPETGEVFVFGGGDKDWRNLGVYGDAPVKQPDPIDTGGFAGMRDALQVPAPPGPKPDRAISGPIRTAPAMPQMQPPVLGPQVATDVQGLEQAPTPDAAPPALTQGPGASSPMDALSALMAPQGPDTTPAGMASPLDAQVQGLAQMAAQGQGAVPFVPDGGAAGIFPDPTVPRPAPQQPQMDALTQAMGGVDTTDDARAARGFGRSAYLSDGTEPQLGAPGPSVQEQVALGKRAEPGPPPENKPGTVASRTARATWQALQNVPENLLTGWYGLKLARSEGAIDSIKGIARIDSEIADTRQRMEDPNAPPSLGARLEQLGQERERLRLAAGITEDTLEERQGLLNSFAEAGEKAQKGLSEAQASRVDIDAEPGSPEYYIAHAVGSSAEMAPALLASVLLRSPLPAMAFMGGYSGGASYAGGRSEGLSPSEARSYATLNALSEGIPEALPVSVLIKPGTKFLTRIISGAATEGAQEMLTESLQAGIDRGYIEPDMTWGEARGRIADAGIIGTISGGMLATGVGVGESAVNVRNRDRRDDEARDATDPPAIPEAPQQPQLPQDLDPLVATMTPEAEKADGKATAKAVALDRIRKFAAKADGAALQSTWTMDGLERDARRSGATEDEIEAAFGGKDIPAGPPEQQNAPQNIQNNIPEAAAQPENADDFEIIDEVETVDGETVETGRKVRLNKRTGEVSPVEPDSDPVQPEAVQSQSQDAPDVGTEDAPATGDVDPDPDGLAGRPAPERKFLDHDETLAIETDPETFQYKGGADTEGVTDRLQGVERFDANKSGQVVIYETRDGRRIIADGHQRTGLARRAAKAGQKDVGGMAAIIYREADGYSPQEVMTDAALKNIAEGSGTATDAARVMRNSTQTVEEMGLPPRSALVRDADGLRKLSDDAFGMVVNGVGTEAHGAIVGRVVGDKALHADILKLLGEMNPPNAAQAEMIARDAAADSAGETQDSLFGDMPEQKKSLYKERAKILDGAIKWIRKNKALFSTLVKQHGTIEGAGNRLDAESNSQKLDDDAKMLAYLQSQANRKGPISDALTEAAKAHADGDSIGNARKRFTDAVGKIVRGGSQEGEAAPQGGRDAETDRGDLSQAGPEVAPGQAPVQQDLTPPTTETTPEGEQAVIPGAERDQKRSDDAQRSQQQSELEARQKQSKMRSSAPQDDSGPLFDTQGDLLDGAATSDMDADAGAGDGVKALRDHMDEAKARHEKAGDATPSNFKDVSGAPESEALLRDLAAAEGLEARAEISDAWVLKQGKATGMEHGVLLDGEGRPLLIVSGTKNNIGFPDWAMRAMAADEVAYGTHNHPSNNGLSVSDVLVGLAGIGEVRAVGHAGAVVSAKAGPAGKRVIWDSAESVTAGRDAMSMVSEIIRMEVQNLIHAGKATVEQAQAQNMHIFTLALDRHGIIDVTGNSREIAEKEGFNVQDIFDATDDKIRSRLRRAGYDVAAPRDRRTDQGDGQGGESGGAASGGPGLSGKPAEDTQGGDGGGRVPATTPQVTGDPNFDGALDDLFGDDAAAAPGTDRIEVTPAPKGGEAGPATKPKRDKADIAKDMKNILRGGMKEDVPTFSTDTAEFKRWFGDSKVVDEDGDPLRLWHGTARRIEDPDFEAFNGMVWASEGSLLPIEYASMRANRIGEDRAQERLIELYMRIERPFNADLGMPRSVTIGDMVTAMIEQAEDQGRTFTESQIDTIRDLTERLHRSRKREESGPHYSRHDFWYQPRDLFGADGAKAISEIFGITGFDGVKMLENGEQTWGAFDPKQVKSPYNRTFDPADANMFRETDDLFAAAPDPNDPNAAKKARDKAEIEARQKQSKMRRPDQGRVEDDLDGLFGTGRQRSMFDEDASEIAGMSKREQIARLNKIVPEWSARGDMLVNRWGFGGIIDKTAVGDEWFVIFNDGAETIEGLTSRAEAIAAFIAVREGKTAAKPAEQPDPKYDQLTPLFIEALDGADLASMSRQDAFVTMIRPLADAGLERSDIVALKPYFDRFLADVESGKIDLEGSADDAPGTSTDLERDRGDAGSGDGVGGTDVSPAGGTDGRGTGQRGSAADEGRGQRKGGGRVSDGDAAGVGTEGDPGVQRDERPASQPANDQDGPGSRDRGEQRLPPDEGRTGDAAQYARDAPGSIADRKAAQSAADKVTVKPGDADNIAQSLPLLLPEQHDDVWKVEQRFAKTGKDGEPIGHGMLITNGTGTGKTYSGGGVIKRFAQQGKTNTLILAPSQGILDAWVEMGRDMGLDITKLEDTRSAGKGIVATTYANAADNPTLATREWDLVVSDESQKLSQNQAGDATGALKALRAITNRPDDLGRKVRMQHADELAALYPPDEAKGPLRRASPQVEEKRRALSAKISAEADALRKNPPPRSKVLFLSATPFAYDKNVDYGAGYLFEYGDDGVTDSGSRQDGRNLFMVENFGYRIRYHKLTKPEAAVDTGIFEREFHEKLKREGVLSGRQLDIPTDYDRKFVKIEDVDGEKIDAALAMIRDKSGSKGDGPKWRALGEHVHRNFTYLRRLQLLEAIKAEAAIPDIQAHLDMGRKVVVFHDYNKGGGFNPFTGSDLVVPTDEAMAGYNLLLKEMPEVANLTFEHLKSPIETLTAAFGKRARLYNGTVSGKDRSAAKSAFNRDNSGVDVIIVQSAAGEAGISLHDTTGTHQRVLINLGMPVRPTTTLQEEGRIRRVGSVTDAAFRYLTTGTAWERQAFAGKIAENSGTVENLALGNEARAIRDAFINAYMDADTYKPAPGEGKGGKDADRSAAKTTPYDQAKTHYFGRTKNTRNRAGRQGFDFYATPEPLGFKMAEWAGVREYEKVLEPSAGDGAIARYLPANADRTIIEPSLDLLTKAQLRTNGAKAVQDQFENHHIVNKYDAVVMNPPFGSGGKTAMDHLSKAMRHVRPGGRVVALIPTGPAADKQFVKMMQADGFPITEWNFTADIALPSVTFEKAGTNVAARVVIFDRVMDPEQMTETRNINMRGADTIAEFFDRLENIGVPERPAVSERAVEVESVVEASPITNDKLDVFEFKNTKTGADTFGVQVKERLGDKYKTVAEQAKFYGGYYSKYQNAAAGAKRGFLFPSAEARAGFIDTISKPWFGLEETERQLEDSDPFAAQFLADLAAVDDLFAYPKAQSRTLEGVFGEIAPEAVYEGEMSPTDISADTPDVERHIFRMPNGEPFYVYRTDADVWFDVSRLDEGGGGNALYAAMGDYAHNSGRKFIGDPEGLSEVALRRRTDAMLSSALKHGTTEHLEPHVYQREGDKGLGVPPLEWRDGDHLANMQALINVSAESLAHHVPEFSRARYDFDTGTFVNSKGERISDEVLDGWASEFDRVREARAGRRTLKRGILFNTLSRAESGQRPGLLERALQQQGKLVEGLRGTFYREGQSDSSAAAHEALTAALPDLRADMDRLNLKRVDLGVDTKGGRRGVFLSDSASQRLQVLIAPSMDMASLKATLHHEVIHALRGLNLFTPAEWRALEIKAARDWVEKYDIPARYPDLLPSEQIEEAIAEAFADAAAAKAAPKGSLLVQAFNKIARLFKALGNALRGAGYQTADAVFDRVMSGEIGARDTGSAGLVTAMREARLPRRQTAQQRAHMTTAMGANGGHIGIPDRRIWEELSAGNAGYWQRLRNGAGAAHDWVDKARIRIQDRFLPVLRAQEAVIRQTGQPLPAAHNAYLTEETFSGKVGRHLFEIDEDYTKAMIDIMAGGKGETMLDTEYVGTWLYARHARERNARIASINPNMPDGGSGMLNADAAQIMADAAAGPHAARLQQIATLIDALRERTLKLREDAGLITADEADLWRNQYQYYVPLKGFADTDHSEAMLDVTGVGRRFNTRGPESKRALGRQSEAFNPLQAAITQAQEVAIRAEKNRVGQALHNLAKDFPSPRLWSVKKPKQKRFYNRTTGLVETRVEDPLSLFLDPNEMSVKIDGQEHRVIFHDERLARSAGSVGADQMGWFIGLMSKASRWFSAVNTMMDPEFVIRNAIRDFSAAQFNIRNFGKDDRNAIAKAMAKNWRKAFVGAFRGQANKADTEWTKYYREFEESGAKVSFWKLEQPEAGSKDFERRVKLAGGSIPRRASRFIRISTRDNPVLGFIERSNLAVDNAIRLAAYVEARKMGWSKAEAASLSKNLTVNFNRRGEWGATINALYPFANAGLQGTQILFRALSSKRMAKYALGAVALGAILDQVNASLSAEDDDGELAYDKIPDWKNQMNLMVMLGPDSNEAVSLWMPYGYNLLPYMGQQASKVMRGVKEPGDAMADFAGAVFGAFSPMGGRDLQSVVTPTMLDPINEMAMNEDWLGRPIRPESPYSDYGPNAYKYFRGASTASKAIADAANRATGGTVAESGLVDVSPEYIDHAFGFVTGGAGRFVGRTVDSMGKLLRGEVDDIEDRSIPFYRSLKYETGDFLDRDRYYRFREVTREARDAVKTYEARGVTVPLHVRRAASLHKPNLAAERVLKKMRAAKRTLDDRPDMSAAEKSKRRARIDEQSARVYLGFNKMFLRVHGPQGE